MQCSPMENLGWKGNTHFVKSYKSHTSVPFLWGFSIIEISPPISALELYFYLLKPLLKLRQVKVKS